MSSKEKKAPKKTDAAKEKKKTEGKKKQQKIEKLEEKIDDLQNELKEKKDKLLRSYADFENYKKRMEKERCHIVLDCKKKYISELIDLKELLLKALDDEKPKEGLRLILKQIEQFFDQENISSIECVGKPFNHQQHHAITTIEKDNCEENIVLEEIKKGYLVEDKVLRPSHVIVSKKRKE
jgi:molecular chaperone GrpE